MIAINSYRYNYEMELWGMEDEESPTWQFLSGEISSKQYVKYLVAALSAAA